MARTGLPAHAEAAACWALAAVAHASCSAVERDAELRSSSLEGGALVVQFRDIGAEVLRRPDVDVGFDEGLVLNRDQPGEMQEPFLRLDPQDGPGSGRAAPPARCR